MLTFGARTHSNREATRVRDGGRYLVVGVSQPSNRSLRLAVQDGCRAAWMSPPCQPYAPPSGRAGSCPKRRDLTLLSLTASLAVVSASCACSRSTLRPLSTCCWSTIVWLAASTPSVRPLRIHGQE